MTMDSGTLAPNAVLAARAWVHSSDRSLYPAKTAADHASDHSALPQPDRAKG